MDDDMRGVSHWHIYQWKRVFLILPWLLRKRVHWHINRINRISTRFRLLSSFFLSPPELEGTPSDLTRTSKYIQIVESPAFSITSQVTGCLALGNSRHMSTRLVYRLSSLGDRMILAAHSNMAAVLCKTTKRSFVTVRLQFQSESINLKLITGIWYAIMIYSPVAPPFPPWADERLFGIFLLSLSRLTSTTRFYYYQL